HRFANQGRIVQMTVEAPDLMAVTVDTRHLPYPPPMTEAVINALWTRRQTVEAELEKLGVTGLESDGAGAEAATAR
ncbi:MAG TPA: hypothetical protein VKB76_09300, partial [Ktedonobacterales bacterium]|nr:hypothetical protein [Ktedonobacterales bacterium]